MTQSKIKKFRNLPSIQNTPLKLPSQWYTIAEVDYSHNLNKKYYGSNEYEQANGRCIKNMQLYSSQNRPVGRYAYRSYPYSCGFQHSHQYVGLVDCWRIAYCKRWHKIKCLKMQLL